MLNVPSMNSPHLFHGESDVEGPSCKVSKGCRFKEKLGDSNIEHRVTAFWQHKRNWWEGGVSEVVQRVEYALWENRETDQCIRSTLGCTALRRWICSCQNQENTRNSVGIKIRRAFWLLDQWLWFRSSDDFLSIRGRTCLSPLGCNLLSEGRCILIGHTALHSSWGAM